MVDTRKVRVTLVANLQPQQSVQELVAPTASKQEILALASQRLGLQATTIYAEDGRVLHSFERLVDGALVYVSAGEPFQQRAAPAAHSTRKYTIAVLGSAAVGKSAVTLRFIRNEFAQDYDPTIEEYYAKTVQVDGQAMQVSVLDTAGMEDYFQLIDDWVDLKDAFVLVYSVDMPDSLERLRYFYDKISSRYENVDVVVLRENTQGLYTGIEHEVTPGTIVSLKVSSLDAAERIARWAFEHACNAGRRKISVCHKRSVLPMADGAFIDAFFHGSTVQPRRNFPSYVKTWMRALP